MKKDIFYPTRYAIIVFLLLTTLSMHTSAQHYISLWGQAGYAQLLDNIKITTPTLGGGGAIGFGYELHAQKFIFTCGVDASYRAMANNIDNLTQHLDMVDSENDPFVFNINFQDRKDSYTALDLNVPVLVGCQFNRFYFLAGGKFGLNLMSSTKMLANVISSGTYPQFIDVFENMPNHFPEKEIANSGTIKFRPDVAASAEIGWKIGKIIYNETGFDVPKQKHLFRIGLFADYGLLNVHNNISDGDLFLVDVDNQFNVNGTLNNILTSDKGLDAVVNRLFVGVKFTVLFQLPQKGTCIICEDY